MSPGEIYGGFARNCRARTVNDADDEALYTVTDDNGCATDPDIFSEWKYDRINGHLTAIFDAFKFPDRSVERLAIIKNLHLTVYVFISPH